MSFFLKGSPSLTTRARSGGHQIAYVEDEPGRRRWFTTWKQLAAVV